jgi:hypothetical protein
MWHEINPATARNQLHQRTKKPDRKRIEKRKGD